MKIGVFDSGVGGITVLTELRRRFPAADYVYLGDTAHLPYGTKSPAQIEKFSVECARVLKAKSIDALVIACNTASSWALPMVEATLSPVPVFGVVGPGVEAVTTEIAKVHSSQSTDFKPQAILVLATRATVQSNAYDQALRQHLTSSESPDRQIPILQQACPLLVPMIEEGWVDHPILKQTIIEYVGKYLNQYHSGIALLGCTHYPWIHSAIQKAMPGWKVVDSSWAIAESLQKSEVFQVFVRENSKPNHQVNHHKMGAVEWIFTDPDVVPAFARTLIRESR